MVKVLHKPQGLLMAGKFNWKRSWVEGGGSRPKPKEIAGLGQDRPCIQTRGQHANTDVLKEVIVRLYNLRQMGILQSSLTKWNHPETFITSDPLHNTLFFWLYDVTKHELRKKRGKCQVHCSN